MIRAVTIAGWAALVMGFWLNAQQPPPMPNPAGKQYPYVRIVTLDVTQIVTTVYTIDFLRIENNGKVYPLQPMLTNSFSSHVTNLPYSAP